MLITMQLPKFSMLTLILPVLICSAILAFVIGGAHATNFTAVDLRVPRTTCQNGTASGILCDVDAVDSQDGSHIQMTTALHNSTGYVLYRERIQMLDSVTKRSASFSSNFTFQITRRMFNRSGDGMAFFMVSNSSYRGSQGSTLGVYRWDNYNQSIFCIEYDTYYNDGIDNGNSNNHVGVDTSDIYSKATGEAGSVGINLLGGYPITSWIDYDSAKKIVEVRIANASAAKPEVPVVSYRVDLSTIVKEFMTVGIAASTGGGYHELYNMAFATAAPQELEHEAHEDGLGASTIAGIAVGGAVTVAALVFGMWWFIRRIVNSRRDDSHTQIVDMPYRFSYQQLRKATNDFSESSRLGRGGSSSVYRGVLPNTGEEVAVKKVTNNSRKGERQFLAEIKVVSRLRHRNLVKLLGWCSDHGNYLLVYELMPNGSLDKHLYDVEEEDDSELKDPVSIRSESGPESGSGAIVPAVLPWSRRSAIVTGVAGGLAYLHDEHVQRVIHRDIKSSNVMLDEDFNARLGDFGLARFIDHSKNLSNTQLAGTFGYIAPEVLLTLKSTDKTDVYAFGVFVLEISCAKRPIEPNAAPEDMLLVDWVWNLHSEANILKAVDPRLGGEFPEEEAAKMLLMGLLCCHSDPDQRPTIRQVQQFLAGDVPLPAVPPVKPVLHLYSKQRQEGAESKQEIQRFPLETTSSSTSDSLLSSISDSDIKLKEDMV